MNIIENKKVPLDFEKSKENRDLIFDTESIRILFSNNNNKTKINQLKAVLHKNLQSINVDRIYAQKSNQVFIINRLKMEYIETETLIASLHEIIK